MKFTNYKANVLVFVQHTLIKAIKIIINKVSQQSELTRRIAKLNKIRIDGGLSKFGHGFDS